MIVTQQTIDLGGEGTAETFVPAPANRNQGCMLRPIADTAILNSPFFLFLREGCSLRSIFFSLPRLQILVLADYDLP
jgi:hypothetical protein